MHRPHRAYGHTLAPPVQLPGFPPSISVAQVGGAGSVVAVVVEAQFEPAGVAGVVQHGVVGAAGGVPFDAQRAAAGAVAALMFGPVVATAQAAQVLGAGGPALGEGLDVIEVAASGRLPAAG